MNKRPAPVWRAVSRQAEADEDEEGVEFGL